MFTFFISLTVCIRYNYIYSIYLTKLYSHLCFWNREHIVLFYFLLVGTCVPVQQMNTHQRKKNKIVFCSGYFNKRKKDIFKKIQEKYLQVTYLGSICIPREDKLN
jgi:hypothetical protein